MIAGGVVIPVGSPLVLADTMSSASYKIEADVISIGGGRSTSSGYVVEDTIGDLATGEDLSSASFRGCSGYQCFVGADYLAFTLTQGTSSPGTSGAGVDLGGLSPSAINSSNGTTINSIFLTAETNGTGGLVITVKGTNDGLASASAPGDVISSATATLSAGTEGYGICVESASEGAESPGTFTISSPYSSSCDKSTNHNVGIVDSTSRNILTSSDALADGSAEILVKAAAAVDTPAHPDYTDSLTFILTSTY